MSVKASPSLFYIYIYIYIYVCVCVCVALLFTHESLLKRKTISKVMT